MIKNKKWTSIVESLLLMLIVIIWIVWMYWILTSSQKLSTSSQNKLTAISIAREWIEWVTNIRDTNWINFSSNINNCWMTYKYNRLCIISNWTIDRPHTFLEDWSYTLRRNNNRWILDLKDTPTNSFWVDYINNFQVFIDDKWFFTQTWATNPIWIEETTPLFTREIRLIWRNPVAWVPQKYEIESIVRWVDRSKEWYHEVILETVLTNWKKN